MRVVRVDDVGPRAPQHQRDPENGTWVDADRPGDAVHDGSGGAARQLAVRPSHECRLQVRPRGQFPAKEAHLVLAAAPFAAGVDMQNAERGQRAAWRPPPRTLRSSASVNGLCRKGRPSPSRNCSVSPRTVDTSLTDRLASFTWEGRPGLGIFEFALTRSSSYHYEPVGF